MPVHYNLHHHQTLHEKGAVKRLEPNFLCHALIPREAVQDAALRLLAPFSIASPVSVYALAGAEIPERLEPGIETVWIMLEFTPAGTVPDKPAIDVNDMDKINKTPVIPVEKPSG